MTLYSFYSVLPLAYLSSFHIIFWSQHSAVAWSNKVDLYGLYRVYSAHVTISQKHNLTRPKRKGGREEGWETERKDERSKFVSVQSCIIRFNSALLSGSIHNPLAIALSWLASLAASFKRNPISRYREHDSMAAVMCSWPFILVVSAHSCSWRWNKCLSFVCIKHVAVHSRTLRIRRTICFSLVGHSS